MHELVIRGGTVVDGTGAPARQADVAVDRGLITAVEPAGGGRIGSGAREIDAAGLLVTPGFVDIHTHYDGQALWDPLMTPSSWHGVTTVVFGNCGVGFAPVRPGSEGFLIKLMEGVEDIPGSVLAEGVDFRWESMTEYLDALAATPRAVEVGAQVPHTALRFYVMGERGADHAARPTEAETARMGVLLEQALAAGALGFTTSRTVKHRGGDGRPTPSLSAGEAELVGLAQAMRRAGRGVIEVNSDFGAGDFELLRQIAEIAGRPLSVLLLQVDNAPELWRDTLAGIKAARARGQVVTGQVGCRPIGILMGLETSLHPFVDHPAWTALIDPAAGLTPADRLARLRADAGLRERLIRERPDAERIDRLLARCYQLGAVPDYEPDPATSLAARAAASGGDARALALDAMMAEDGQGLLLHPFENYSAGSLDVVREMLLDDATVMGLADGGAHVATICDASAPTFLLSHWARDRSRGPRLPLELLVHKQTRATALAYGLADRGALLPGLRADIAVIELDRLRLGRPGLARDLPAGGKRLVQRAEGYRHVLVGGVETLRDDRHTGALPGGLVRG